MDTEEKSIDNRINRALNIKERYQAELMNIPDVVGIGVGFREVEGELTGEVALIINVKDLNLLKNVRGRIPEELEGIPVDVKFVGDIRAF